jgi:hypothetical protein
MNIDCDQYLPSRAGITCAEAQIIGMTRHFIEIQSPAANSPFFVLEPFDLLFDGLLKAREIYRAVNI